EAAEGPGSARLTARDPQPDAAGVSPELRPRVQWRLARKHIRPAEQPGRVQSSPAAQRERRPVVPPARGPPAPWSPSLIIPPARGPPSPMVPPARGPPAPSSPQPRGPPSPMVPPARGPPARGPCLGLLPAGPPQQPWTLRTRFPRSQPRVPPPSPAFSKRVLVSEGSARRRRQEGPGSRRPPPGRPRGGVASWRWLQVPGLGFSAAAPACAETRLPSHPGLPPHIPGPHPPARTGFWGQAAPQNRLF
ncbi:unnamed protein product, partial [Rangifer tarandus platyrhynchus]